MQQLTSEPQHYQDDEIDLRELLRTLYAAKKLIISITVAITVLAGIYAYTKTPNYENTAEAFIEIGYYNDNDNHLPLISPQVLAREVNFNFSELINFSELNQNSILITTIERQNPTIKIVTKDISQEISLTKIKEIIAFIQSLEREKINQFINSAKLKVGSLKVKINEEIKIKNEEIKIKNEGIKLLNNYLNQLNLLLISLEDDLNNSDDESVIVRIKSEIIIIFSEIKTINLTIFKISQEIKTTYTSDLNALKNKLKFFESKTHAEYYNNSVIIGDVMNRDTTNYPKKQLIVSVALIAGFMFSILLAFIMNAFKRPEDEKAAA